MNNNTTRTLEQRLIDELSGFGIACTPERAALLIRHLLLVIEKNKVVNLTRITDPSEAVTLHLVDSLLPLASNLVVMDEKTRYVDMGTGAGFPGLPLAIMTGAHGMLIDSVGKKVAAVQEFAEALECAQVETRHTRVEDLPRESFGTFDYVFARAVAQSNVLIEYATPLLKKSGLLVLEKARPTDEELAAAERAAQVCGLSYVSRETYELPHELGHRELLFYKKTAKPRVKLPRKAGLAKKEPLGL